MYEIIFFLLVPFIAMLYEGLHRKINARLQNRIGPPIIQPFYDIKKLFQKKKLKSQNDPFFNYSPFFYFLSTYALFLFIPFSIIAFNFDFVVLVYITILSSAFYVLAGLSSDNPFGIVGSMREMILMIAYEIALVIVIFNFMIKGGVFSLANFNSTFLLLVPPALRRFDSAPGVKPEGYFFFCPALTRSPAYARETMINWYGAGIWP